MTDELTDEEIKKRATEALTNMFQEAQKVVKQMLTQPYPEVVKFKDACLAKATARILKNSPDIDTELAVAMSFVMEASEHLVSSHPGAVSIVDGDNDDNVIQFRQ